MFVGEDGEQSPSVLDRMVEEVMLFVDNVSVTWQ